MIVAYKALWLKSVYEFVLLAEIPDGGLVLPRESVLVPYAVEPDGADFAVACEELGQLGVYEFHVVLPVPVLALRPACPRARPPERVVVRAPPVQMRVVEMQLQALSPEGVGEFREDVSAERCGLEDVVFTGFAVEH